MTGDTKDVVTSKGRVFGVANLFPLRRVIPISVGRSRVGTSRDRFLLACNSFRLLFNDRRFSFMRFRLNSFPANRRRPFARFAQECSQLRRGYVIRFSIDDSVPLFHLVECSNPSGVLVCLPMLLPPFFAGSVSVKRTSNVFTTSTQLWLKFFVPMNVLRLFLGVFRRSEGQRVVWGVGRRAAVIIVDQDQLAGRRILVRRRTGNRGRGRKWCVGPRAIYCSHRR